MQRLELISMPMASSGPLLSMLRYIELLVVKNKPRKDINEPSRPVPGGASAASILACQSGPGAVDNIVAADIAASSSSVVVVAMAGRQGLHCMGLPRAAVPPVGVNSMLCSAGEGAGQGGGTTRHAP